MQVILETQELQIKDGVYTTKLGGTNAMTQSPRMGLSLQITEEMFQSLDRSMLRQKQGHHILNITVIQESK